MTGLVIRIFDTTSLFNLRYSRAYNGIGTCAFTLAFDDVTDAMLNRTDMLIEVQRTSPITGKLIVEENYLARNWHRFRENNQERYVIGALSLNHLIARRIIVPDDDPDEAGGYSTKSGACDTVLFQYANQQMGAACGSAERRIPGLTVAGVAGTAPNIGLRLAYDNLFQVFQVNAKQAGIDFQITRTNGVEFELNIGYLTTDRTEATNFPNAPMVLLDPRRGNLSDPSLMRDRKNEANFVFMRGKGQGSSRYTLPYGNNEAIAASPFNRIEIVADARNTEKGDSLGILTEAQNVLKERQQQISFSYNPEGTEAGNVYRLNWDVGDLITATWGDDTARFRITGIEITLNGSEEQLNVTTEVL